MAAAQSASYVASIKPNTAVDALTRTDYSPGGRFTATAVTVRDLLRLAYRVQPFQLTGAPGWISTRRYDIAAKSDDRPAPSQQEFLRVLLKDRFHLEVRNQTREMPVFALVVARPDGKLGPQLTKSRFDCAAWQASPHAPPQPGQTPNCGMRVGPGSLSAKAIRMAQLAATLAALVSRSTLDKTGLAGLFDAELKWAPDQVAADAADGPSIFAALQQQLGLKLAAERGPVEVLVVDRVEEPSGN